jgi:integrase
LAEAKANEDDELADFTEMAMWSGARIEELCSLAVENVKLGAKVPHFTVTAGKTDAAIRDVPVHTELLPVLRRLIGERTTGYVLAGLTADSDEVAQAFRFDGAQDSDMMSPRASGLAGW